MESTKQLQRQINSLIAIKNQTDHALTALLQNGQKQDPDHEQTLALLMEQQNETCQKISQLEKRHSLLLTIDAGLETGYQPRRLMPKKQ